MNRKQFRAVTVAVGLAAGKPLWAAHPVARAVSAAGLVMLARSPLGLRPPALCNGLRVGLTAGGLVAVGVAVATASPRVRAAMASQQPPASPGVWLGVGIPLSTVWPEEAAYRGALTTLAADGFGQRGGRLLQATAFGLFHVHDARAAGQSVLGTVVVTGIAGWLFGWLAERSGSLAAPMLAHLAVNEAGAVAALAVLAMSPRPKPGLQKSRANDPKLDFGAKRR